MKKIILFFLLIILLLFVANMNKISKNTSLIFQEKLPKEFDEYDINLNNVLLNSNLDVTIFKSIYPEDAIKLNDSITYFTVHKEQDTDPKTTVSWFKVNNSGEIIDSLSIDNEWIKNLDAFLLNKKKDYYLTWLIDGDTTKKPFILIDNGEVLKKAYAEKQVAGAAYSTNEYAYDKNRKRYIKIFFYKNRQWYQLSAEDLAEQDSYYTETEYFPFNYVNNYSDWGEVKHYQKKSWYEPSSPHLSFNPNGIPSNHWEGHAYIDLKIKNETLKIKNYCRLYPSDDVPEKDEFNIYKTPEKSFYILKTECCGERTLYLIK